jgi:hypothetical protein
MGFKTGCMGILRDGMRRGVWQNSRSILVRLFFPFDYSCLLTRYCDRIEMLTPIDQPLDKLEDLTPEEMSVPLYYSPSRMLMPVLFCFSLKREHEGLDRALYEQVYRLW